MKVSNNYENFFYVEEIHFKMKDFLKNFKNDLPLDYPCIKILNDIIDFTNPKKIKKDRFCSILDPIKDKPIQPIQILKKMIKNSIDNPIGGSSGVVFKEFVTERSKNFIVRDQSSFNKRKY
jgi:hypothetical protein